ncbi:phage tail sheath family protein [Streptomyces roseifaciens]
MPVPITYPGVYIDEVKSSVRTITGVPTSIAAFVGWAPRGPDDRPVHITSWADYEQQFGGLHQDSAMSYAVEQFYRNGGAEAEIVRVVRQDSKKPVLLTLGGKDNGPKVAAIGPGAWVENLRARVEPVLGEDGKTPRTDVYNFRIRDFGTGAEEVYLNVSTEADNPRSLRSVLAGSLLVTWHSDGKAPTANQTVPGLDDQMGNAEKSDEPDTGPNDQPENDTPAAGKNPRFTTVAKADVPDDKPIKATDYKGSELGKTGLHQLLKTDIFNILCLPDVTVNDKLKTEERTELLSAAAELCLRRRAILLVDPPAEWTAAKTASDVVDLARKLPLRDGSARNAAIYFPRILASDACLDGLVRDFPPCGVMAGVMARTDAQRGVWKAPAGTDASLNGVQGLEMPLTDLENGRLNPLGVNCLRELPAVGPVAWGARTMRGNDQLTDEWKYLPVRRLALFVEESLYRGTQWVVFEPNDEPLWASIRLNIGAFMNSLFREGAFQGRTPAEAYLVKCDRENNPQNDIDRGIVNIQVGFAPLKPAEFVIIHIQQLAGQVQV